jgi:hypothetical protein
VVRGWLRLPAAAVLAAVLAATIKAVPKWG